MHRCELEQRLQALRTEGEQLAGGLTQLAQRASVYRHLYRASGGNHIFPLIAAHGALWARGYFQWALGLGRKLAWQYALQPAKRRERLAALDRFADAFRDINRKVCADTYANFHFTAEHGRDSAAAELVPAELLEALNAMHAAQRDGRVMTDDERRAVFTAHFLYEQQYVVGPSLDQATADFDWPVAKWIALKPVIHFAYFPEGRSFWFRNFSVRAERVERGLQAFELASAAGFERVEADLSKYQMLPARFFSEPAEYFADLRREVLVGVA